MNDDLFLLTVAIVFLLCWVIFTDRTPDDPPRFAA